MATLNPFDLLVDDDAEDPSQLIAAAQQKAAAAVAQATKLPAQVLAKSAPASQQTRPAQLPSKPLPPAQAGELREVKNEGGRGGGRGYGRGRGGGGFIRDQAYNATSLRDNRAPSIQVGVEDGETEKSSERHGNGGSWGPYRSGRRGGLRNGEFGDGERPRRAFERHSGTGRGSEVKRDGAGRGNWGTQTNEITEVIEEVVNETEKNVGDEKAIVEEDVIDVNKENIIKESEEKKPEDKEMTLDEYEKVLEEKRKALQELKTKERKVDAKEFASMQQLSNKKENDDVFIKLGSDKDKRKESSEKEERSKKPINITDSLKPRDGERYNNPGGRGRGLGRGSRGGYGGAIRQAKWQPHPLKILGSSPPWLDKQSGAPSIEDPGQFPTLAASEFFISNFI